MNAIETKSANEHKSKTVDTFYSRKIYKRLLCSGLLVISERHSDRVVEILDAHTLQRTWFKAWELVKSGVLRPKCLDPSTFGHTEFYRVIR